MIRSASSVILVLALAGCGFHLRDKLALPEDTPPVRVVSSTPFSELVTILERNLRNAGATVAPREQAPAQPASNSGSASSDAATVAALDTGPDIDTVADPAVSAAADSGAGIETGIDTSAGADATGAQPRMARLDILSERWGDLPIAIDERGRAQEFSLRYATIFTFRLADGTVLVPQQVVELSRDYVSPPQNATGTSTEREILADELRREMAASIMRRIDSVVRASLAREAAAQGAAATPAIDPVPAPASSTPPLVEPAPATPITTPTPIP